MKHFAAESHGVVIQRLRKSKSIDDIDPPQKFSTAKGEPMIQPYDDDLVQELGNVVDETLFTATLNEPFPELFDRALMVVAALEAHGYYMVLKPGSKNDPAGITMGIIGFTAKSASLMSLLTDLIPSPATAPDAFKTFMNDHGITDASGQEQLATFLRAAKSDETTRIAACAPFIDGKKMVPRWEKFFRTVLSTPAALKLQDKHARKEYFDTAPTAVLRAKGKRAEDAAALNSLTSELGLLLAFSTCVQAGNLPDQKVPMSLTDRQRRIEIAVRRSSPKIKTRRFEQRHIQLAKGYGFPNRQFIDVTAWGFEPDPPPAAASRILSLAFSDSPSMLALPQFEAAAVSKGIIQQQVITTDPVPSLLTEAKVPNGKAKIPDFSRAWDPSRRKHLRLFAQLDELPIDCLVLGGEVRGTALAGSTRLLVFQGIVSWKNADWLDLPFVPRMPNGLVIVVAANGLPRFSKALQDAIERIDGIKPLVVGWKGSILKFPADKLKVCADEFFGAIKMVMQPNGAPKTLPALIAAQPERVIQAWGQACFNAFHTDAPPLWRATRKNKAVISSCAALSPAGETWLPVENPLNGVFMKK
jgi:hypothetical protein